MESKTSPANFMTSVRALEIYLALCTVLVLIILFTAFASNDQGTLTGEIYVQAGVVEQLTR